MPKETVEAVMSLREQIAQSLIFAAIGITIGIGQCLRDKERDRAVIVGRALCVGGMAMSAGAVLIWVPNLPWIAQFGVAATLASLGTSGLERLLMRVVEGRSAPQEGGQ